MLGSYIDGDCIVLTMEGISPQNLSGDIVEVDFHTTEDDTNCSKVLGRGPYISWYQAECIAKLRSPFSFIPPESVPDRIQAECYNVA